MVPSRPVTPVAIRPWQASELISNRMGTPMLSTDARIVRVLAVETLKIDNVMDDRRFAIPWSAIRVDNKDKQLVLNVNREQLMAAPVFDKDHWPDFGDQVWVEAVHNHYGSKPYWD